MALLYISERGKRLLDVLLAQTDYITMDTLTKILDVSRRTVYYDISKVNIWLVQAGMPALEIVREKGLFIPYKDRERINNCLDEYYGAAEPPVRCGESHLSGLTEPPQFVY